MPRLMQNDEWIRTVDNVRNSGHVWIDTVAADSGAVSFTVPEAGGYQIIMVKLDSTEPRKRKKPNVQAFLGYGAKFHKLRTTEEWMKELREGEEE